MMRTSLLVATMLGLVGCVGGVSSMGDDDTMPNPTDSKAKQLFDTGVYPVISSMCSSCHTTGHPVGQLTGFVGDTEADGYATATGYTALVGNYTVDSAPILTKIAAGHNGITYTTDDVTAITAWLNEEVAERDPTVPPPGTTAPPGTETAAQATDRVIRQWSGCMTLANFNTANMATGWANMQASNNQQCMTCHVNCADGMCASPVADDGTGGGMFWDLAQHRDYMMQFFMVDLTGGTTAAKMMVNTQSFTAVSGGLAPHLEHPRFTPDGSTGMTALQTYYTSTALVLTNGQCGPSVLVD